MNVFIKSHKHGLIENIQAFDLGWWHAPVMLALWKAGQVDYEFELSLGNFMTWQNTISKYKEIKIKGTVVAHCEDPGSTPIAAERERELCPYLIDVFSFCSSVQLLTTTHSSGFYHESFFLLLFCPGQANAITFRVVQPPRHGMIERTSRGQHTRLATSFTMEDIYQNRVSYSHDGSNSLKDRFTFTVSDGTNPFFIIEEGGKEVRGR